MPRRTSRDQLDRFLRHLTETGNFALAADLAGLAKSGLYKRRARDAAFDKACEAALSSPVRGGGPSAEERMVEGAPREHSAQCLTANPVLSGADRLLTKGGDLAFSRYAGRPQLRRTPGGRLTQAGRAALLDALAETASIRAAAAAIGIAHSSVLWRARRHPAFGRRLRATAAMARDRALWARTDPDRHGPREDWVFNADDRPIPPMTAEQAMLQLIFHNPDGPFQRSLRRRRRPPPPLEQVKGRILAKIRAFERAMHFEETGSWVYPGEMEEE
jgi:hypothetical protein